MPKHDIPHRYTATTCGQEHLIAGMDYNPTMFGDVQRQSLYAKAYNQELSDLVDILDFHGVAR